MKHAVATLLLCILGIPAIAQFGSPDRPATRSVSGQFIICQASGDFPHAIASDLETNANYLALEPTLLAVYCERVKQTLWRKLGVGESWRGQIFLTLHPAQQADESITVLSAGFSDGWKYQLELPNPVERDRFIRALVNVLLLELANRKSNGRSAEIPVWLGEGLTQQLLAMPEVQLTPPPTRWTASGLAIGPTSFDIRKSDSFERARRQMRERPPLTLEELSWPDDEQLSSPDGAAYRGSAQLFVTELLRLKDGAACLRELLAGLGQCYNWQIAFLRAFPNHFGSLLDLEKWWALQVVHFTGHDPSQMWSPEESWNHLDGILRTAVLVRSSATELPTRADVSLQTVLREWDRQRQTQTLRAKLRDLELARPRMSPELAGLADDYRQALAEYLEQRARAALDFSPRRPSGPLLKNVVRDALMQLDALEIKRQALLPAVITAASEKTGAAEAMP